MRLDEFMSWRSGRDSNQEAKWLIANVSCLENPARYHGMYHVEAQNFFRLKTDTYRLSSTPCLSFEPTVQCQVSSAIQRPKMEASMTRRETLAILVTVNAFETDLEHLETTSRSFALASVASSAPIISVMKAI